MLEILGTIFGSVFSGGATGILGVIAQRYADYKNKELDIQANRDKMAHEAVMRDKDAAIMAQEWAGRVKVAETEADAVKDAADAEAFAASFKLEPSRYSEGVKPTKQQSWVLILVDAFRGIVRPALTVYLCVLTTLIYWEAKMLVGMEDLNAEQALDMMKLIIGTVLYLTTTCVLWWFGTRNKQQTPSKG